MSDLGPWLVRVSDNKVSVGIFVCHEEELAGLIDEACDADLCEYRSLPSGGLVFGGEVVLHEWDGVSDSTHLSDAWLTDSWQDAYRDAGEWQPVPELNDND